MNVKMKDHHKDQLLNALMHYLPMDIRTKVMNEVPAAYNDFYALPIVGVVYVENGQAVS
jgi:hypothetical protein